jgi:hypothetical protein
MLQVFVAMQTHDANFAYVPLDAPREIRLLEIIHTEPELVCNLSTVSLHDKPRFSALSYEWGGPTVKIPITVNGRAFPVTANLARALENVRHHWTIRFPDRDISSCRLWADAICINQNDIDEKNQQIQLMQTLYATAEIVLCWIGSSSHEYQTAFESFLVLGMEVKRHPFDLDEEVDLDWMKQYPALFRDNCPQRRHVRQPELGRHV